ncbi:circadian clock KaiB family protein [Aeoliella sp. ICT_H6.2]|uniref:Circadian clock KaiB family protein n=1 Tax=Aeoliella straminimaris TaxID=2954799 RepID=A0A9X2F663_9BACT|nr:circadian clock KaiB family protein [Aeoliella straminimaris]MCO6042950.1 circadian clock KaiB family protein [Aeoliella straminimaris]
MSVENPMPTSNETTETRQLILFLAEGEPNSIAARRNLENLLASAYDCQVQVQYVDVLEEYEFALEHRVLVTPTLLMIDPLPRVMIVGTLKDTETVITALRLRRSED